MTGETLGERLAAEGASYVDRSIIAARDAPYEPHGGLVALFGNLAPGGAILKRSAADAKLFEHEGRAVVFSSLADLAARIDDPSLDVTPQDVLVLQNAGPHAPECMLNALLDYSKTRVTRAGGRSAENPFVQLLCAETASAVDEMTTILHRNFRNLHAYARRGETPPLEERLCYKFQSTAVTERCTLLAARIFKATGAAGLQEDVPFGGILADLMLLSASAPRSEPILSNVGVAAHSSPLAREHTAGIVRYG